MLLLVVGAALVLICLPKYGQPRTMDVSRSNNNLLKINRPKQYKYIRALATTLIISMLAMGIFSGYRLNTKLQPNLTTWNCVLHQIDTIKTNKSGTLVLPKALPRPDLLWDYQPDSGYQMRIVSAYNLPKQTKVLVRSSICRP